MTAFETRSIQIRPDSSVYATYRRLAYKPWYAIGEFVDNSTQNFFDFKERLREADGKAKLIIDIAYDADHDTLVVADNAHGMCMEELERAVQLYKPPVNRSGRSEFGMGLKTAACWLGRRWRIVTKRLGESVEYEVQVDVERLEENKPETIEVLVRPNIDPRLHYTRIEIEGLYRKFRGRTIGRIKQHLASMYRRDLRSGEIVIMWDGQELRWEDDPVFREELPDGRTIEWKKYVEFTVAEKYSVRGCVWIRIPGNARLAGLHLFRRGRLILGGPGEGYKPEEIFGPPNSFQSQRLVGELDLDDWPVNHTKDGFDWAGDLEHEFIQVLREEIADYIEKCEQIKTKDERNKPTTADGQLVGDVTREALEDPALDEAMLKLEEVPPPDPMTPAEESERIASVASEAGEPTIIKVGRAGLPELRVYWSDSMPEEAIYAEVSCPNEEELILVVNLNHPFVVQHLKRDPEKLALWAKLIYVDALVERGIRRRGLMENASVFRRLKDHVLRSLKPEQ